MRIADKFTVVRIIAAPIFFVLYFFPWAGHGAAVSVFVLIPFLAFAEFTDFLDGYFARKFNQVSDFGKLFDPFADVMLHLTTFFCFVLDGYMLPIIFLLIFFREMGMNFVRLVAAKKGVAIGARKGGKFKTVLYVVTGFYYLIWESCFRLNVHVEDCSQVLTIVGFVLSGLCLIASYFSFIDYLVHFKTVLKGEK